ncbi:EpsG family protein [Photobacterium rosenbergii]|uniref:EpsG family protein n=1 Tax=Photobacterium rosenbergii TaxID=294936 RepID=UPI0039824767
MLSYVSLVNLTALKILLLLLYYFSRTKIKPLCFPVLLIIITLVSIVYYSGNVISHDSIVYYIPYYNDDTWRTFEPGYMLLNEAFKWLGFSSESFILYISIISLFLFCYSLYKLTDDLSCFLLCLFFIFCTLSFNFLATGLLRQYIAFVLVFLSLYYFSQERKKYYQLLIFASSMIHFSSIVYLAVVKIKSLSFDKKLYLLTFSFILAVCSQPIVGFLSGLLPTGSDNIYLKSLTRVLGYSDKNIVHDNYIIKYSFVFICMFLVGGFYRFFYLNNNLKGIKSFETVYAFSLCGFLLSSLTFFSSEASIRVLYGVVVFNSCALGILIRNSKIKYKEAIVGCIITVFFIYSFISHQWITEFVNRYI